MRPKQVLPIVCAAVAGGAGMAIAAHPEVDPAGVPTGFLAAHNQTNDVPVRAVRRVLRSGRIDGFLEHVRLAPREATAFVTHPGPVFVMVAKGRLTNEEASGDSCRRRSYVADRGFVTRGVRTPHRITAGPDGVDYYAFHLTPRRTGPTQKLVPAPDAC